MAGDTYIFTVRAVVSRWVLEKIPRECPSWYHTNLKICALERGVEKFKKKFWVAAAAPALGGKVSKKKRKAMANGLTKLHRQAKKLRTALGETLEERYRREHPTVPPAAIRRALAAPKQQFEKTISEIVKEKRSNVLSAAEGPKGLKS
jgi:hypothetical protein